MALSLDRAVMDENVLSTLLGNKAIAFGIVKPLDRACYCFRHNITLYLDDINARRFRLTLHIVG